MKPFIDSTSLLDQPQTLRQRMQEEGYLFIRNLLPQAALEEVSAAIITICQSHGWADAEGHAQGEARLEGSPDFWAVYDDLQRLEAFHALAHRPELLGMIETLVQETPFVHHAILPVSPFPAPSILPRPPIRILSMFRGRLRPIRLGSR